MPDSIRSKPRWYFLLGVILSLSIAVVVVAVIAGRLRGDLTRAERVIAAQELRLGKIETRQIAQETAATSTRIGQCYSSARGRPAVATILRLVAGLADDPEEVRIVNGAIEDYVGRAATISECDERARDAGLDPNDFRVPVVKGSGR